MGIPWETIIKEFRSELDQTKSGTIDEYAEAFIEYVKGHLIWFPASLQEKTVRRLADQELTYIRDRGRRNVGTAASERRLAT